jgi:hypothetical protein
LPKLATIKHFIGLSGKRHHANLIAAEVESLLITLMLIRAIVPDKQFC